MRRRASRALDPTADTAVTHLSGSTVLNEVLARITDERDRVLILAHMGFGIPLGTLAAEWGTSPQELAARTRTIMANLHGDPELAEDLGNIRYAGRREDYYALALSLGLQHWFCAQCGEFMIQKGRGRTRKTCSKKCRNKRCKRPKKPGI